MKWSSILKRLSVFLLVVLMIYGGSRLYYQITHGFTIGNITSNFSYDRRWDVRPLSGSEQNLVDSILDQKFTYLGKGCQAYVFVSEDGNYVLKFFKYQRFRPQAFLKYFDFIPAVHDYRQMKIEKKRKLLDGVFNSWKIAFENLKEETGLIFVHLNKTTNIDKTLLLYDKMGLEHHIKLDHMEFLLQKKAEMLCPTIEKLMNAGHVDQAKQLISRIISMLLSEYSRGFADNDHALMQNTGVYEGNPIHIDVGQFVKNNDVKQPEVYKHQLFSKTYRFRIWLEEHFPELGRYLEIELRSIIGEQYSTMVPYFKPHE